MDALTFLRQDHKSVLGMLEVLDEAPSGSGAEISGLETMVTNPVIAESQHEAIEEQFFWPAVRAALQDGDALADEAIKQEQDGKKLLQRLADGKPGEAEYHEALQQFVKTGREHIAYEQDAVRPRFEAAVSREHLDKLGESLNGPKRSRRPVRTLTLRRIPQCLRRWARSPRLLTTCAMLSPVAKPTTHQTRRSTEANGRRRTIRRRPSSCHRLCYGHSLFVSERLLALDIG